MSIYTLDTFTNICSLPSFISLYIVYKVNLQSSFAFHTNRIVQVSRRNHGSNPQRSFTLSLLHPRRNRSGFRRPGPSWRYPSVAIRGFEILSRRSLRCQRRGLRGDEMGCFDRRFEWILELQAPGHFSTFDKLD